MAILASIDVDDTGSLKISNFRDQLSAMGASVVKTNQQVGQSHEQAADGAKKQGNALDSLRSSALGVASTMGALSLGTNAYLKTAGDLAARVQVLNTITTIAARNANISNAQIAIQTQTIKHLGITTQEATNTLIQFMQANLRVADASKLARAAQDMAVVAGENSSQTLNRFMAAIQTGETMLLRQVGIVTTNEAIYRKYAQTIGKSVTDLDALDKKQAMVNKIMEESAKVTGAYEAAMGDVGKQQTSLARYSEELALSLGQSLLPAKMMIVQATTKLLKGYSELPGSFQGATTAAMVFVAALSTVAAAMAGAKLLGIVDVLSNVANGWKTIRTAMLAAEGTAAALSAGMTQLKAVMSTTAFTLGSITVALAALAAIYVAVSSAEDRQRDAHAKATMEMAANAQRVQELTTYFQDQAGTVNRTAKEWALYNANKKELNKIAPSVISALGQERQELILNKTALEDLNKQYKYRAEQRAIELKAEQARWEGEVDKLSAIKGEYDKRGQVSFTGKDSFWSLRRDSGAFPAMVYGVAGMFNDRDLEKARRQVDVIKKELAALNPDEEKTRLATKAQQDARDAISELGDSWSEAVGKIKASGAVELFDKLNSKVKTISKERAGRKVSETVPMTADDYAETLRAIMAKVDEYSQHMQQKAQQAKNAFRSIVDQSQKDTATMQAQRKAFEQIFGPVLKSGDMERETELLKLFGGQLEKLGTPAELAAQGLKYASKALQDLMDQRTQDYIRAQQKELDDTVRQMEETARSRGEGWGRELVEKERASREKMADTARDINDRIYEQDRDLYEKQVVSRMSAADQAIFAENKRVEDVLRSVEKEIAARDRALQKEREAVNEKARLTQVEIADMIRKATLAREIKQMELESELEVARYRGDDKQYQLAAELDALEKVNQKFKGRLEVVRTMQLLEVEQNRQKNQQILDNEKTFNDQIAKQQRDAAQRQVDGSRDTINRIKAQYSVARQAVLGLVTGVVDQTLNSFGRMLTGASSFADGFLGIWQGIKNTLLNVWNDMVQSWLGSLKQMLMGGSGGSASSMGGMFAGLMPGASGGSGALNLLGLGAGVLGGGGGTGGYLSGGYSGGLLAEGGGWSQAGGSGGGLGSLLGVGTFAKSLGKLWTGGTRAFGVGGNSLWSGQGFGQAGGMLGTVGGSVMGAGVGIMAGQALGSGGSYWSGALGGAASGALTGLAFGGPIGAAIGGIAGLISGLISAAKARKAAEEAKNTYLEQAGGLAKVTADLKQFGSTSKLDQLNASNDPGETYSLLAQLQNDLAVNKQWQQYYQQQGGLDALIKKGTEAGIDVKSLMQSSKGWLTLDELKGRIETIDKALQLKEAKDGLAKTTTALWDLKKSAASVGYDLQKLYDAKTIEEFNGQQKIFNDLLDKQKVKLEGMKTAASGIQTQVTGMMASLSRVSNDVLKNFDKKDQEKWSGAYAEAQKSGYVGSMFGFLNANKDRLSEGDQKALAKTVDELKASYNRLGREATATFGAMVKESGDLVGAMEAIGPSLDGLVQLQSDLGVKAEGSFAKLLHLRATIKDNEDIATSISGITQTLKGMADAGMLTQEMFTTLGDDAATQYSRLKDRGVDANDAMLMMQPTLQGLWQAQKDFGYQTDAATQALINQGVEQGLVGDKFQDVNRKILDVLLIIADALGAKLPEAYTTLKDTVATQSSDIIAKTGDVAGGIADLKSKFDDAAGAAQAFGRDAAEALDDTYLGTKAAAYGKSPGGMIDVTEQTNLARAAFENFGKASGPSLDAIYKATEKIADLENQIVEAGMEGTALALHQLQYQQTKDIAAWLKETEGMSQELIQQGLDDINRLYDIKAAKERAGSAASKVDAVKSTTDTPAAYWAYSNWFRGNQGDWSMFNENNPGASTNPTDWVAVNGQWVPRSHPLAGNPGEVTVTMDQPVVITVDGQVLTRTVLKNTKKVLAQYGA